MVTRSKAAPTKHRARPAPAAAHERPDPIPCWPQLKLDIVRRYGAAYSTISSRQPGLAHYWIDGFIRPGADTSAREFVPGSPLNALLVTPPFHHHYLVDMDGVNMPGQRADALRHAADGRADVTLFEGDGGRALLEEILPRVRQEDYRRALCVLDPGGPALDWRVIEAAGRLRTIDLFAAFADAGDTPQALKRRLQEDAGFANVLDPLPLRDRAGRIAAHLFFASRNNMANGIVEDIFTTHRDGRAPAGGTRA
jgi:hypothetical protein